MKIIFSIATVGQDFYTLDESRQEFLLRRADKEKDQLLRAEKIDEVIDRLHTNPFTSELVSISFLNTETGATAIMYKDEIGGEEWNEEENNRKFKGCSEAEMLTTFWRYALKGEQMISFNGREFDIPYLKLRSAILRIKCSRNLMRNRYDTSEHLDLLEKLSFHGIFKRFDLDFYCKSFGVEYPFTRRDDVLSVKELYNAGRIKEIAEYCAEDVRAIYTLHKITEDYL